MSFQDFSGMHRKRLSGFPGLSGKQWAEDFKGGAAEEAVRNIERSDEHQAFRELMQVCEWADRSPKTRKELAVHEKAVAIAAMKLYRAIEDGRPR